MGLRPDAEKSDPRKRRKTIWVKVTIFTAFVSRRGA